MKKLFSFAMICAILAFCIIIAWGCQLKTDIQDSLESGWFVPPTQIYTGDIKMRLNQHISSTRLSNTLESAGWKERGMDQSIIDNEFTLLPYEICQDRIDTELPEEAHECLVFKSEQQEGVVVLGPDKILDILLFREGLIVTSSSLTIGSTLFAQFIDNKPIRQNYTNISQFPTQCLDAIVAIEDDRFLEHKGISPRAIFRAFFRNIKSGRLAEGGSTITQQLIKNKFLSSEKTLLRKIREAMRAVVLEISVDKNKILESYLNITYMGQDGPFEVRGFPAAAEYYFNKNISDLNLRECASLAGSVKGPGIYGPHRDKNKERTDLVLKRMHELAWISDEDFKEATEQNLRVLTQKKDNFLAHYFIDAVHDFIRKNKIDRSKGLKVYTTLSDEHQKAAEKSAKVRLDRLKENSENPKLLEGLIVSADPRTGEVLALVGGSDFKTSPYNRAIHNYRQIGSLMKPFVYLSALLKDDTLTPTSLISNASYTFDDRGKKWTPLNYDKKAVGGEAFLFQSLMLSLNIPSARVGMEHSTPAHIVETVEALGGPQKRLQPYPSVILGAFEFYPLEVLQIFATLSQLGTYNKIHFIKSIENLDGEVLWTHEDSEPQQTLTQVGKMAEVVGMLKNTLKHGTARSSYAWQTKGVYAGKTGTTSFHKDAWFAGFSKEHVAIAWVGYDKEQGSRLTGAGSALPLWMDYIRERERAGYIPEDFDWPENVRAEWFSAQELQNLSENLHFPIPESGVELVIDRGF